LKTVVIANPISGGRQGSRRVQRLVDALAERRVGVDLHWTTGPGDAAARARGLEAGVDRLVIAGGDGTLNEVLNGLRDPTRLPVALLPTGTANLIARDLKLPRRPDRVADLVVEGRVRPLDMGLVGKHRFLAIVSCGFDAMVVQAIQRTRSGSLGYRGYLAPILRTVLDYEPPELRVSIDGKRPRRVALVIVSNVRNYAGLFSATDRAQPDSGVLDVCLFPKASVPRLFRYVAAGFVGRLSRLPDVIYRTGRRIEIESEAREDGGRTEVPIQVDGDPRGTTPVTIELAPLRFPMLVPGS
jgi:YegS/Rv2252/BmrU family lipid kinase